MKLSPNQIISDRYQIIEQIGIGGMANVYCAQDIKLDRKVTFKVLKEEFVDKEFIEKFSKEAMAAAKLSHTNIANVYDFGNDGNIYYIVMEYIDGYTLKDIIKIKAPFSNEEVLGISIQIANALSVAHNSGIIHRDIKPENILITKDGIAKVTDFGIARATTSNTVTIDNMGSVHYFSPEQAKGGFIDSKTDIYSLGIVMFEMVTGKLPFDGEGVVQLAMKHINEPLPNMKEINPNVSESVEKIILKATNKSIVNRYRTAESLINDLKKALSDESGNFVTEEDFADSPTVIITPEEIEMINKLSNIKYDDCYESYDESYENDYYEDEDYEDEFDKKGNAKMKKPYNESISEDFNQKREKDLDKKITIFAILTGLSIVVIISAFLIFWIISGKKSEVPNFVGKTYEQAVEIAKQKEIYIRNVAEEYSDTILEGQIISQNVEKGQIIQKGETIDVVISLGTGKFELKDFVGLDISEVYRIIENEKINLNFTEEYINDKTVERGKVIRQVPSGGSTVKMEDKVTLYVSKGKEDSFVIVPRLKNLSLDEAKQALNSVGLKLGNVSESESNAVEKDKIISQSSKQGSQLEEGDRVDVVISTGKPKETTTESTTLSQTTTEQSTEPIISETTIETSSQVDIQTETTSSNAPILKDDVLNINPSLPEGSSEVEVKVIKKTSTEQSEIYVRTHNAKDFPLKINVRGSEPTEFQLYIDGKLIGTETKFN